VHGGPGNSLESVFSDLEPLSKGRTVIYYDQRGNGRSDLIKDGDKLGYKKHIADLEAVRQYFKLDRMTLFGNSWGGVLVGLYAAAFPDRVERIILADPGAPSMEFLIKTADEISSRIDSHYDEVGRERYRFASNYKNWLDAKQPKVICREFYTLLFPTYVANKERAATMKGDVCSGSDEAVRYQQWVNREVWNSLGKFDIRPSLSVVKSPALVIHGVADPIPVESAEAWVRSMPNARLLLIKGAGHLAHIEQPEIYFPAVETFLKGEFPKDSTRPK
jgi:proline iminopeptidase